MGYGCSQLNVAHAFPAHLGTGYFNAAAFADLALVTDALVLAAVALPVLGGSEDPVSYTHLYNQDSAIHLSSTGDHVLYIVSKMCIRDR